MPSPYLEPMSLLPFAIMGEPELGVHRWFCHVNFSSVTKTNLFLFILCYTCFRQILRCSERQEGLRLGHEVATKQQHTLYSPVTFHI